MDDHDGNANGTLLLSPPDTAAVAVALTNLTCTQRPTFGNHLRNEVVILALVMMALSAVCVLSGGVPAVGRKATEERAYSGGY